MYKNNRVHDIFSQDADFQKFQVLKTNRNKRHRYGEFFVEGVRNLNQAVENGGKLPPFSTLGTGSSLGGQKTCWPVCPPSRISG